ncbi:MAG: phosphoribosylformylglycinamidine synthase subunit PurQ, partial [Elusimicrobia bacterium]|nr:phosphoribosylformylglycinamidine synthase subunit PurQ [Elusimicrobiota bacterium]
MKKPKVLVLRTAGTNCDLETASAFKMAGGDPELLSVRELLSG